MFVKNNISSTKNFLPWLKQKPDILEISRIIQKDAQIWEQCLWTSGGLLNLKKCLYYIMAWEFNFDGSATFLPATCLPEISISPDDSGTWSKIQH